MNEQTIKKHRVFSLINVILTLSASFFAFLKIADVWQNAYYAYLPMMMLCFYIQAYLNWATSRKLAIFHLIVAIIGTVACITLFFI